MRTLSILTSVILAALATLPALDASAAFGRTQPVYNVVDKPIHTPSGKPLDLSQVEQVLRDAAMSKGWTVDREHDGHLQAEIHVRQHWALVDITFTESTYSISYRDSKVLKYDGEKIHRNYNKWVKTLERLADDRFSTR